MYTATKTKKYSKKEMMLQEQILYNLNILPETEYFSDYRSGTAKARLVLNN